MGQREAAVLRSSNGTGKTSLEAAGSTQAPTSSRGVGCVTGSCLTKGSFLLSVVKTAGTGLQCSRDALPDEMPWEGQA